MSKQARIVGWSHLPFGKLIEPDTESLMARVSLDALRHAGAETGDWVLVDLGEIIVHVMQPAIRTYYNLEQLWGGQPPAPHPTTWRNAPGAEPPAAL